MRQQYSTKRPPVEGGFLRPIRIPPHVHWRFAERHDQDKAIAARIRGADRRGTRGVVALKSLTGRMSSFYDRTDRILARMAEIRMPADVWANVVTKRMEQTHAYFSWVVSKRGAPIAQNFPPGNAWGEETDDWRKALGIDGAADWWAARFCLVAKTGQLFAHMTDPLYNPATRPLPLNALARYWFGELHDLGHAVARASGARVSDNPYPPRPKPRGIVIPDSDCWLRETYPHLWVD